MILKDKILKHCLIKILKKGIKKGKLVLTTPSKEIFIFEGTVPGQTGEWILYNWSTVSKMILQGDIGLGEAYTEGLWDSPDLIKLYQVFIDNINHAVGLAAGLRLFQNYYRIINTYLRRNSVKGSKSNIKAHYDVGNEFYELWLDKSLTYSSGIFSDTDSLEKAQENKYYRILNRLKEDHKDILEIGCGWGGFVEAATNKGYNVTGLTISPKQYEIAKNRTQGRSEIKLQDYRLHQGKYDGIISIEMFEAVGERYWKGYFKHLKSMLKSDGVAVIQTITIANDVYPKYAKKSDYIRHHVFPGGMLPSPEVFEKVARSAGLVCNDVYHFGECYAKTLMEWLERLKQKEQEILSQGRTEEFIRSWRLYMSICAAAFLSGRTSVMQVELRHAA